MREIQMLTTIVLIALSFTAFVTPSPVHEQKYYATEDYHYIPTLEELQSGIGIGDPTSRYTPVIKMINGHITEQSREEIEQFHIHYDPEMNLEGEMVESQEAYNQMVQALAEGDEKEATRAETVAKVFMEKAGLTIENKITETPYLYDKEGDRAKRFVSSSAKTSGHWDKCIIPYEFDPDYFTNPKSSVEIPMKIVESYTGFRFVEWNESTQALYGLPHNNRLRFVNYDGCWSYVGNLRGEGQRISCCSGSTCIHEIGHALGFHHEQKSAIRDDYMRIEWNGIDPDYWSQYYIYNKNWADLFGYYDPSSVMHYWNGAFGINHKLTMTSLDPDLDYLLSRDTSRYYYFFYEAMATHKCWDLFCSENIECKNGGYSSVVKGECTCRCPIGLDPKTKCSTQELTDSTLVDRQWPAGSFAILNSVNGCPEGFDLGWQYHKPPNYVWGSTPYHATPSWGWWSVQHEFCSRTDEVNDGPEWPPGSYCIYRKGGSCPTGFDTGYIQMDDAPTGRTNVTAGELPDGVYGANTRWEFCCRSDFSGQVEFPTKSSFILFHRGSGCLDVKGMTSSEEYFTWRSETADNYHEFGGEVPYHYDFSDTLFNLYFCYYTPINKDCGGVFNLDSTPLDIQSMNYPSSYDSDIDCVYTLLAPENNVIQIDFEEFEIDCEMDTLEIAASLPGHKGAAYCGSGFSKSIISSTNYMRVTLRSTGTRQSGNDIQYRFKARVQLKTDTAECITNKGKDRSYSGVSSYTKNFEPCLPWNEVQNCKYHRFAPETFDDDLSENYCRYTRHGTGPWCYTNAETCARGYCDACSSMNCYDLFDDCSDLIDADPSFCSTNLDGQALRGCRFSCELCEIIESETVCSKPSMVDGIAPSPLKTSYTIGEQVEYVCPTENSNDVRTRTCTSSGTWTDLGFVCGACPMGWGLVDGKCYKWFDTFLNRNDARAYCENMGATLPTTKTQKQLDYIRKIVDVDKEQMQIVWLAMSKVNGAYEWDDGTDLEFLAWGEDEPSFWGACVTISSNGWDSYACSYDKSVVCMHTPSERTVCADQSRHCEDYIRATPDLCVRQQDFAEANCPYSCGICKNEVITIQRNTCFDVDSNCDALVKATDDFCVSHTQFAYTHCQATCNMCDMYTSIDDESDQEDIGKRWMNSEYMPELRESEKRSFDDCVDSTTTKTTESTTSTTERTTSPTESTTSPTESTTSTTESTTSTTESTTSPTESTTSTTESTTSTTESTTTPTESTTSTTESTTSTTESTTSPTESTTTPTESTTSTTESTTSTTESTTSTTESTTSTTESTTSATESTTSTTESTTSTTESTTSSTTTEPTTSTASPPVQDCDPNGQPAHTNIISTADDTGQIYEYVCDNGFALSSGNLIRACLVTGELTGSPPVCLSESEVELPVNDVNIRRRDRIPWNGYTYTAMNKDFIITKSGKLTKWRFYSSQDGDISLQVWRFSNNNMDSGTLIGSNFVSGTGNDRIRTIEIPESEQISVQVGDVIAMQQPLKNAAYIGYTRCDLNYEPTQNNQLISNANDEPSSIGSTYGFQTDSNYDCKTMSLNAFIK